MQVANATQSEEEDEKEEEDEEEDDIDRETRPLASSLFTRSRRLEFQFSPSSAASLKLQLGQSIRGALANNWRLFVTLVVVNVVNMVTLQQKIVCRDQFLCLVQFVTHQSSLEWLARGSLDHASGHALSKTNKRLLRRHYANLVLAISSRIQITVAQRHKPLVHF